MSQAGILNVESDNPEIPIFFETNSGTATAFLNVLKVLGGVGATTSGIGNVITINTVSEGYTWNTVTSVSPSNPIQLMAQNGYVCQGALLVTFLLPLAPNLGDTFIIFSYSSRFQINQNANQIIQIGAASTTVGATGHLNSNSIGDALTLVYVGNNVFQNQSMQGTLTLN